MKKITALFESYNLVIEKYFDDYEKKHGRQMEKIAESGTENDLAEYVARSVAGLGQIISTWETEGLEALDGKSPAEFFAAIDTLEELLEVFKTGALLCDETLPHSLINRLKEFDSVEERLLSLAVSSPRTESPDGSMNIALGAIKVLGGWSSEKIVAPLMELMEQVDEDNELFLENISLALTDVGLPAAKAAASRLEASEKPGLREEYLMSVLAKAGSGNKSDEIYRCLKNTFSRMENKVIGALYLAEYGDGRAIPALRGYVERDLDSLDRVTFYEIKHAIEVLGGSMEDIRARF